MQAPFGIPATATLAICGWTEQTSALVAALEARGLRPVAIGDRSAAALIAAAATFRGRTDNPARYQHPREMLRRAGGDTVLLDMADAAAEAATLAQRGAAVLVTGDALEPETLEMLARTGAVASIVRPLWWRPPIAAAIAALANARGFRHVTITVEEDRPALAIAEDLVTLAAHLSDRPIESITASAYGPARGETESVITELGFTDGGTALLVARDQPGLQINAEVSSLTYTIEAEGDGVDGSITVTENAGRGVTTILTRQDAVAAAVTDALDELAGGGIDAERLFEEAAALRTFGRALDGTLPSETRVPRWEVLTGGGHRSAPRRGHLHLVRI